MDIQKIYNKDYMTIKIQHSKISNKIYNYKY